MRLLLQEKDDRARVLAVSLARQKEQLVLQHREQAMF